MDNEQMKALKAHGFSIEDMSSQKRKNDSYVWIRVPSLAKHGLDNIRLDKEEAKNIHETLTKALKDWEKREEGKVI